MGELLPILAIVGVGLALAGGGALVAKILGKNKPQS